MQALNPIAGRSPTDQRPFALMFPTSWHMRLLMHAVFWALFMISHLLYFWPLSYQIKITTPMLAAYGLYYMRYIPVFYACMRLYDLLRKHLSGFHLWLSVLVSAVVAMHVSTLCMFYIASLTLSIQQAAPAFGMLWKLYLQKSLLSLDGLFMILYDFEDLQLLLLPAAIKTFKTAITNERISMQMQRQSLLAEIEALKAQLSPHLIFNLLNAAYAELLPTSQRAASYLGSLSSVMRYTLYKGTQHVVELKDEIGCLKNILALESARSQDRSKITYKQTGRIKKHHQVPALLLVSLAENAIKHGVHDSYLKSYVKVRLTIKDDMLDFYIINSLPLAVQGDAAHQQHSGIGLKNIVRRLELQYPNQHTFSASRDQSAFTVHLMLPMHAQS